MILFIFLIKKDYFIFINILKNNFVKPHNAFALFFSNLRGSQVALGKKSSNEDDKDNKKK